MNARRARHPREDTPGGAWAAVDREYAAAATPNTLHCYRPPTARQQAEGKLSPFDRDVLRVLRDLRGVLQSAGMTHHYVARELWERQWGSGLETSWPASSERTLAALASIRRLAKAGLVERTTRSKWPYPNAWNYRAAK